MKKKYLLMILLVAGLAVLVSCVQKSRNFVESYTRAGVALSKNRLPQVQRNAAEMQDLLGKVIPQSKSTEELQALAGELAAAKDLPSARKSYEAISNKLIAEKSMLKIQASEFYCPMLKKSWLQIDEEVVNPYDPKMPGCGMKK